MTFKLGYSTYALRMLDPFDAIQLIKDSQYEAVEICLRDGWPTSPLLFSNTNQLNLRQKIQDLGFPSPILFGDIDVCASSSDRTSMLDLTMQKIEMAHKLHFDNFPIMITTTIGKSAPAWESGKVQIKESFLELADIAAENNVVIAIEGHAGTDFETPEKAVWLMEQTLHPNLKIDLDISHYVVEGIDISHTVNLCSPYTSMIHIKDGKKSDGKVEYCLTGDGEIDIRLFLNLIKENELDRLPIFAEVSVQQSSQSDYNPETTANFCFQALDKARNKIDS